MDLLVVLARVAGNAPHAMAPRRGLRNRMGGDHQAADRPRIRHPTRDRRHARRRARGSLARSGLSHGGRHRGSRDHSSLELAQHRLLEGDTPDQVPARLPAV